MRLLVAEDVPVSRKMLEGALRRMGHDVILAENGRTAWEILSREPIKMVIADWMMPEMDGLELVRRVRQSNKAHYTYIIVLTARGESGDRIAGLEAGADDYVTKPFEPEELMFRIRAGERIIRLEQELTEQNEQLGRLATFDQLTALRNRRSFDDTYVKQLAAAKRYRKPLALAMIDIDHFKAYNDEFGHGAGDRVLRKTAEILEGSIREADLLYRYGGEEFVCLLPMTDLRGAGILAERLRSSVEAAAIAHPGNPPYSVVTICLGYACYDPDRGLLDDNLLCLADQAVYECKAAGRNRTQAHGAPAPQSEKKKAG